MKDTITEVVARALSPWAWGEKPAGHPGTQAEWDAELEQDREIVRGVAKFVLSAIQSSGTHAVVPVADMQKDRRLLLEALTVAEAAQVAADMLQPPHCDAHELLVDLHERLGCEDSAEAQAMLTTSEGGE